MTLNDVPNGSKVFVDANIFIYHFTSQSAACGAFLRRCEHGDVLGYSGAHLVMEAAHHMMIFEAVKAGLITSTNPTRRLKEHPDIVKGLRQHRLSVEAILDLHLEIVPLTAGLVRASLAIREKDGLLSNDSASLAMMQAEGIQAIATRDDDFRGAAGLVIYQPDDV